MSLCVYLCMVEITEITLILTYINSAVCFETDEGNRRGPVDPDLWKTIPETLFLQCRNPDRPVSHRIAHVLLIRGDKLTRALVVSWLTSRLKLLCQRCTLAFTSLSCCFTCRLICISFQSFPILITHTVSCFVHFVHLSSRTFVIR